MNWQIITSNIREAREELEKIERLAGAEEPPEEGELLIMLEHAYHHLNFAWNARNVTTDQYASMGEKEFNQWGKYPTDLDIFQLVEEAKE